MLQERKHTCYSWYVVALLVVGVLFDGTAEVWAQSQEAVQDSSLAQKPDPVGYWQSVDFVKNVDDFIPGQKKWEGDLFRKDLSCFENGESSIGWTWKNGSFFDTKNGSPVSAQYYIKAMNDSTYLFFPWFPSLRPEDNTIFYYVLKKISDQPQNVQSIREEIEITSISSVRRFEDIRWKDLSNLDLSGSLGLIKTLWFHEKTIWPDSSKMPGDSDPEKIMIDGMNPGLGIHDLHNQGITGKGVTVAIIDQPLYLDHPEYVNKIAAYHDVGCGGSSSSMHGPAVTSLLVGSNCGTAPEAKVYFVAAPSWTKDAEYYAKALDWIVEQNEKLPLSEKIRVVSVSAVPSGPNSPFVKNCKMWDESCARSEAKGIMVLDGNLYRGFIGPCYYDISDPENLSRCKPGYQQGGGFERTSSEFLLAPSSPRTTAEEYNKGECLYQYCGTGGLSWSIPYCAGVLALGWQLRPDLTPQQMKDILFQTAYVINSGKKIINPQEFINVVKNISTTVKNENKNPGQFMLHNPYPNPFNPSTTISYQIPEKTRVTLRVFNINGQEVNTLVNNVQEKGLHSIIWDGTDSSGKKVASGMYLYRLNAGDFSKTQKMTFIR